MYELICMLWAIYGHAKNCHYKAKGRSFFGQHLLADRVIDNIDSLPDYADDIEETAFLGKNIEAVNYKDVFGDAKELIPDRLDDGDQNFINLYNMYTSTLEHIESLKSNSDLTTGDNNLIGNIAQDLQQSHGFLWREII